MLRTQIGRLATFSAGKVAVACPGQGIVPKGCLYGFRKHEKLIKPSLHLVDEVLGENFSKHLLEEPSLDADVWSLRTSNAQPAILTATFITYLLFRDLYGIDLVKHEKTGFLLGHSLGEYSALTLGGVLEFGQAVKIVRQRGVLMEELVKDSDYSMMVLVFRPKSFDVVSEVASKHKVLACVNNSSQVLISGSPKQLETALAEMPKGAVLKLVKLPVKIPFHNELLGSIEPQLAQLSDGNASPLKPIISNLTGSVGTGSSFLNTVKDNSKPVLWKQSLEFLKENEIEGIVNLGPGLALGDMNKRSGMENYPLVGLEDMEKLAQTWDSL